MDIEKAKKKLKLYSNIYDDSVSEMYKVILLELEKKDKEIEQLEKENEELLEVKISASAHNQIGKLKQKNEELREKIDNIINNTSIDEIDRRIEQDIKEYTVVPTEKERKLQIYINQLVNDLFNNERIEVNSKDLLELLSYLTSNTDMSSQMKTATEYQHRNIADILHKREVDILKERLKQVEEERNPYRKQLNDAFSRGFIHKDKIKEKIEELKEELKYEITKREAKIQIKLLEELLREG